MFGWPPAQAVAVKTEATVHPGDGYVAQQVHEGNVERARQGDVGGNGAGVVAVKVGGLETGEANRDVGQELAGK